MADDSFERQIARVAIWVSPLVALVFASLSIFAHWNAWSLIILAFLAFTASAMELLE